MRNAISILIFSAALFIFRQLPAELFDAIKKVDPEGKYLVVDLKIRNQKPRINNLERF